MRVDGKVVLITGVGTGIGKSIAFAFARSGCDVIVMARSPHRAQYVAAGAAAQGVKAIAFPGDSSNRSHLRALARTAMDAFGKIDVLVHAPAISTFLPAWPDSPLDQSAAIIESTPMSAVFAINAVLPHMLARRKGAIITFCEPGTVRPFPRYECCATSNQALARFTVKTSDEITGFGIRINTIVASLWSPTASDIRRPLKTSNHVGCCATLPNQVAACEDVPEGATDLTLFLAGETGREISGRVITANLRERNGVPEGREADRPASIIF